MSLDTEDKNYIKTEFEGMFSTFSKKISEDMQHQTGILKEHFEHKLEMVAELVRGYPSHDEVREIALIESRHVVRDELNRTVVPCIKEAVDRAVNKAVDIAVNKAVIKAVDIAVDRAVDKSIAKRVSPYLNDHERRIRKLEVVVA
jgi:hypothetical protein